MTVFSTQEIDIATDPITLLIKNRIMEKTVSLMGEIEQLLFVQLSNTNLPPEINLNNGKISKGENYKYLPYVMLDYPGYFTKKNVFALRTMFYWGNFISITIHLKGNFLINYSENIIRALSELPNIYFNVNNTEWEYDYNPSNYILLADLNSKERQYQINEHGFIKLSLKWPIAEIHNSKVEITKFMKALLPAL